MEVREVVYWRMRLDNVISDYRNWSLSLLRKLARSDIVAVTSQPVIGCFFFKFL